MLEWGWVSCVCSLAKKEEVGGLRRGEKKEMNHGHLIFFFSLFPDL